VTVCQLALKKVKTAVHQFSAISVKVCLQFALRLIQTS